MIETRSVHEQLATVCLADLAAGRWQAGEQFPSERDLAATHQLSRATANKVLAKLVSEGWLEMRKGLGCFVADRPTLFASLRRIESFTDFAEDQGFKPSTRVLEFQPKAETPVRVRLALKIKPSDRVIFTKRLRLIDGETVILEERWLPATFYPRLSATQLQGSFYQLCRERYGLTVQREEAEIRAAIAPAWPGVPWTEPALPPADLILAGDVFYDAAVARLTLPILSAAAEAGTQVLIGDPFRRNLPLDRLQPLAEYDVPDMGSATPVRAGVFALRPGNIGNAAPVLP